MFCAKCGTQLADDAKFCFNCGNMVVSEPIAPISEPVAPAVPQPIIEKPEPISAPEPVVESFVAPTTAVTDIATQPTIETQQVVQQTYSQPAQQQQMYAQPVYQQVNTQPQMSVNNQPVFTQPMYNQPVNAQPVSYSNEKKSSGTGAAIMAILFGILSMFASSFVSLYYFKNDNISNGCMHAVFALVVIFAIICAFTKGAVTSVLKGIGFLAVTTLYVIFAAIPAAKDAIHIFGNAKKGTDYYYAALVMIGLIFLALYMIINIIKCFMNSKKASMIMLTSAYIVVLAVIASFVINFISADSVYTDLFAFKFLPVDTGFVLLILTDIFAWVSRGKKNSAK